MSGWTGVVLAGGASTRMGRDKALVTVRGTPMARRVADALTAAGAAEVFCVGGDAGALAAAGLDHRADDDPGAGPLAAVVTALRDATHDVVFVAACDLVDPDPEAIRATLDALNEDHDAAVPTDGTNPQPLHAAYKRTALECLEAARAEGERSITRALARLRVAEVTGIAAGALRDADTPSDLEHR